jgi:hypothetical protein
LLIQINNRLVTALCQEEKERIWSSRDGKLNIRFVILILILYYQIIIKKRYSYESTRNGHSRSFAKKESA